ncbi:class I SAM-dependent methyltransferase [Marinilactibacillus sp. Marseille-P9653]|uniref:class I SAM-dependent DNA methyltransferase n=1 Tax=Marinilactibacillus sp. Marseille-P9653 TaxID=2866583 RepID=UPI0021020F41|nr:methyltransferase domain-containing protein [Marinilactibacillus sp. Marseille-P9653]
MGHIEAFDKMAATYDKADRVEMAKKSANLIRRLLNHKESKSAIDFGCGTGLLSLELSDAFESILMIDSSAEMIKVVEKKIKDSSFSHLTPKHLDIETNRVLFEKVDTIFMSLVLHHIADPESLLMKLSDAIYSGGQLMIIEMERSEGSSHHPQTLSQKKLLEKLPSYNFKNIYTEFFYQTVNENKGDSISLYIISAEKV